jgi:tetratricopeptide (TPR) repeat protein
MQSKKNSATVGNSAQIENPQTAEDFAERAWNNYSRKAFEQAEADFRRSLDMKPDNPDAMYALGLSLAADGKSQEAISTFQDVIEYLNSRTSDETRVRNHMLIRLSRGHINRIKTGEWRLEV